MPKLLIICSVFPPQSEVGGLRPAMMAKYLPRFGWETYVLTRDYDHSHASKHEMMSIENILSDSHIVRIEVTEQEEVEYLCRRGPCGTLRDIITFEKSSPPGVFDKMWNVAKNHYAPARIDAIWATAPDFPSLRLGRDMSKVLRVPWVADFRDITEQMKSISASWRMRLRRMRVILRRSMLVRSAACLTSVSSFHCGILAEKTGKTCELIYNGYNTEMFFPVEPVKTERFRVVYFGRIISKGHTNPELLFAALDSLISERLIDANCVDLSFYATEYKMLNSIVGTFRSWKLCHLYDRIDYKDVPAIMSNASVLLLLSEYGQHGVLGSKLFEYLAVEKPILCVRTESDSEMANVVNDANAGYAGDNLADVKAFILRYYGQWRDQGYCSVPIKRDYVMKFSREVQAMRLAALLNRVVGYPNAID